MLKESQCTPRGVIQILGLRGFALAAPIAADVEHHADMPNAAYLWRAARRRPFLILAFALLWVAAQTVLGADVMVNVSLRGEAVFVDVRFAVPVSLQEAWAVLTDYDGMPGFVSNLSSSAVVARSGGTLQVEQTGKADYGPWSFSFDTMREIRLFPYHEIRSRLLHGSLKKLDGVTTLTSEGAGTVVTYHGESIPNMWIPPIAGPTFIAHETEEQFQEMRKEILRRRHGMNGGR
jgi:hypothetical protein